MQVKGHSRADQRPPAPHAPPDEPLDPGTPKGIPKKPKLSEPEIHAVILSDVKIRLGCKDFAPEFTLHCTDVDPAAYPHANWDVQNVQNAADWKPECAEAFNEADTELAPSGAEALRIALLARGS